MLEIGCGTGRVLIPTLEAGIQIDGLDYTSEFLDILRGKLDRLGENGVRLFQADMRDFDIGHRYQLITAPFRPLQHLITVDDQIKAFRCIRRHIANGGVFAFNVFYPKLELMTQPVREIEEVSWQDPEAPHITVKRYFLRRNWDRLNQFIDAEFIFRSFEGTRKLGEERHTVRLSYFTYPHMLALFRLSGFEVAEEYGTFSGEPISVCRELIFVARAVDS